MYRHHPQTARVAELVAGGAIGELRAIRAAFSFPLAGSENVRLWPELDGGALMDVGCYCVSGARLLAGEPERVYGEQVVGPTGVDVTFAGTLRFPGDVVATFHASMALPLRQELEALGSEGTLLVEAPFRVDFGGDVLLRRGDRVERVEVPEADSYRLELDDFAAAAAGERPPLLGRDDAVGAGADARGALPFRRAGRVRPGDVDRHAVERGQPARLRLDLAAVQHVRRRRVDARPERQRRRRHHLRLHTTRRGRRLRDARAALARRGDGARSARPRPART